MPLITANQFQLQPDYNSLTNVLGQALGQRLQKRQVEQAFQRQQLAAHAQTAMSFDDEQKAIAYMTKIMPTLNPEDKQRVMELANAGSKDEVDLFLARMLATNAPDQLLKSQYGQAKTKSYAPIPITNPKTGEIRMVLPKYNPNTDQAELSPLDIPEGFEVLTETPEQERQRDMETEVEETEQKEGIKTREQKKREENKKQAEFDWAGRIEERVQVARAKAKAKGEALTDLEQMEAALPELQDVVGRLKDLSEVATYTTAGRVADAVVRELGFPATKGATARAKYIATIQNVVLPLLKPTFGAAFTVGEGEKLEATLGNPDLSPEEKQAALEAFIDQKIRNIRMEARKAGAADEIDMDVSNMTDEQLRAIINE